MKPTKIDEARFATFADLYRAALAQATKDHPEDYVWGRTATVEGVAARMLAAVREGSFNKDGRAFKAVCKTLKIAHTYKAIYTWLEG